MKLISKIKILGIFLICLNTSFSQEIKIEDEYFEAAQKAEKGGNSRNAANLCIQGLKRTPYDVDLKQLLGKCYMNMKMMDSARYFLQKVIIQDDNNVEARHFLVNVEYQTKRYSSAICYVNELLEKTPYWKGLWLKKIAIYNDMENYIEVKRAATRLRQIFPNDSLVEANYSYIMNQEGIRIAKSGDVEKAKQTYLDALKENPENKDIYISLINLENSAGRVESGLEYAERALIYYPNDLNLIKKKIGNLEMLERYDAAISYLKLKKNEVPFDFYRTTEGYLISQAALFYENTDPYILHQKAYASGNRESYNYILNKSIERGHYNESLALISEGLLRSPGNKELLVKQMFVYKRLNDLPRYRKSVITLHEKYPGDYDINQEYAAILLSEAKEYTLQKQYQAALDNYNILLKYPDYKEIAESNIFAIYTLQNNNTDALKQINSMVERRPGEKMNLVKKAELLVGMKKYNDALDIVNSLMLEFPEEEKYKKQYVYYSELYLRDLLLEEQYLRAFPVADKSLDVDNKTELTYTYAINAAAAIGNYEKMLVYADSAVYNHPDNTDFKIKKIAAHSGLKEHKNATEQLEQLKDSFPNDIKVRGILAEERFKLAVIADEEEDYDEANLLYNSVLILEPANIAAYQRLVNLSIKEKDTANAMMYVDRALRIDPNPETRFFQYKKGVIYEMMEDYENAYYYQKLSQAPKEVDLTDHLDYLTYHPLNDQIGVSYLRVFSGEESFTTALASIYYQKVFEKNEYGGAFNYASRSTGIGVQLKGTWVHKFSKTLYTQLDAYYGSKFFPRIKVTGNAYKSFESWEANVGLGYTILQNKRDFINLILGGSKELGDFYLTGRINLLYGKEFDFDTTFNSDPTSDTYTGVPETIITGEHYRFYTNYFLQAKYNVNDNGDYFVAMTSVGNAPQDEFDSNFQISTFLNSTNSMVGAGYWWNKHHKYKFGIQGNWYSFKTVNVVGTFTDGLPFTVTDPNDDTTPVQIELDDVLTGYENQYGRVDQYHIYFTVQTKF